MCNESENIRASIFFSNFSDYFLQDISAVHLTNTHKYTLRWHHFFFFFLKKYVILLSKMEF